jgi:hypothetical protein
MGCLDCALEELQRLVCLPIDERNSLCLSRHPSFRVVETKQKMMKFAAISLLAGSAAAFMPVQQSGRAVVSLNAERSKSLPFMNRPPLVSLFVVAPNGTSPQPQPA